MRTYNDQVNMLNRQKCIFLFNDFFPSSSEFADVLREKITCRISTMSINPICINDEAEEWTYLGLYFIVLLFFCSPDNACVILTRTCISNWHILRTSRKMIYQMSQYTYIWRCTCFKPLHSWETLLKDLSEQVMFSFLFPF